MSGYTHLYGINADGGIESAVQGKLIGSLPAMPTASAEHKDIIVYYAGTASEDYATNTFYKCVEQKSGESITMKWIRVPLAIVADDVKDIKPEDIGALSDSYAQTIEANAQGIQGLEGSVQNLEGSVTELQQSVDQSIQSLEQNVEAANSAAQEAAGKADEASSKADEASSKAEEAKSSAEEAKSSAEEAKQSAENVSSELQSLSSEVQNAASSAENAMQQASEASSTAGSALSTAQEAQNAATNAQSEAQGARDLAQEASIKADGLDQDMNDLSNEIQELHNDIMSVSDTANMAREEVSTALTIASSLSGSVDEFSARIEALERGENFPDLTLALSQESDRCLIMLGESSYVTIQDADYNRSGVMSKDQWNQLNNHENRITSLENSSGGGSEIWTDVYRGSTSVNISVNGSSIDIEEADYDHAGVMSKYQYQTLSSLTGIRETVSSMQDKVQQIESIEGRVSQMESSVTMINEMYNSIMNLESKVSMLEDRVNSMPY